MFYKNAVYYLCIVKSKRLVAILRELIELTLHLEKEKESTYALGLIAKLRSNQHC